MDFLTYFFLIVGSYLVGSLNGSIVLSRLFRIGDIRKQGSGNAGATNMARVYGWGFGVMTLCFDVLKGVVCTQAGNWLLGDVGVAVCGFACLLGHCFPAFYHFKGGKGISVGAALGFAIDWRVLVTIVCIFLIGALVSKKVSLGSVCATIGIAVASFAFGVSTPKLILALCTMVLVLFQHRSNIRRLLNGTEPDFRAAKPKKNE